MISFKAIYFNQHICYCVLFAADAPEEVIKVYRGDQSYKFLLVNRDTTAGDVVDQALREFMIIDARDNYSLYKVP